MNCKGLLANSPPGLLLISFAFLWGSNATGGGRIRNSKVSDAHPSLHPVARVRSVKKPSENCTETEEKINLLKLVDFVFCGFWLLEVLPAFDFGEEWESKLRSSLLRSSLDDGHCHPETNVIESNRGHKPIADCRSTLHCFVAPASSSHNP